MIEKDFDVPFVARLARKEKQIQQNYRPIIGVHKWFARRPGTLFRALLLAEFANEQPLPISFFQSNDQKTRIVGDPFMGGGTPLLEANRLGCHVVGADINPMAYWVVRQEITNLDRLIFQKTADQVVEIVEAQIGIFYKTTCDFCGQPHAPVKYFLWVKQKPCSACQKPIDLFRNYIVAKNQRHPNYVLVCPTCGVLNEVTSLEKTPGTMHCDTCAGELLVDGPAKRNRCKCPHCSYVNTYPDANNGPPLHRLFALEYHCPNCASTHRGRFFKAPAPEDQGKLAEAEQCFKGVPQNYVPTEHIPPGDETTRLHRWGYQSYHQLFNSRQLLGLQTLATTIAEVENDSIRYALLTVFSDTLRYQNMLCRYDTYALKVIDIFSVHGFPVSLIQCENSLLGIPKIGSGGFRHFVEKYDRAKAYCEKPFETYPSRPKKTVPIRGEQIGAKLVSSFPLPKDDKSAYLHAASAETLTLPAASLDAVFTDPPYFANVQYAELMDFCYVWLKKHLAHKFSAFRFPSTRSKAELTVNQTEGRDIIHFTEGLSQVFVTFTQALKIGAPFTFTYHHNDIDAYLPIAVALLDARLVCTATLPCPAEMSASIHINGTKSSVVDTIFACRTTGKIKAIEFKPDLETLRLVLGTDITDLQQSGVSPTSGDIRCLLFGHLIRLAVWELHSIWDNETPTKAKLAQVKDKLQQIHPIDLLDRLAIDLASSLENIDLLANMRVKEQQDTYNAEDQISF